MIQYQSLDLTPDLSGALYIAQYKALLVADLHFEKGSSLARFGVIIPPFDTRSTLDTLEDVVGRYNPETLISLGDSFHDKNGPDRLSQTDLNRIQTLGAGTDILWITGNHDPELPSYLPGKVADEVYLGSLTLRHEPTIDAQGEICGHLHPVGIVKQRGRRIKRRCFAGNQKRLFMPAFGAYTGGLNVKSQAYAPYWNDQDFTTWLIGKNNIHRFASHKLS